MRVIITRDGNIVNANNIDYIEKVNEKENITAYINIILGSGNHILVDYGEQNKVDVMYCKLVDWFVSGNESVFNVLQNE